MLFVAHYGQIWYVAWFNETDYLLGFTNILNIFTPENIIRSCNFSTIAIIFMISGIIFIFNLNYRKTNTAEVDKFHCSLTLYKHVAWAFIFLFFPFQIYILYLRYYTFNTAGYLASVLSVSKVPGILSAFGELSSTGMALLLVSYQNNIKKQSVCFLFLSIYFSVFMVIGWRNTAVTNLIILGIIFFSTVKLSTCHKKVLGFVLISLAVIAINVSRETRSGTSISIGEIFRVIPLLLMDFGAALYSLIESLIHVGVTQPEWYGVGYVAHAITIFPNIFGIYDGLTYYIVEHFLPETIGKGGSIIAELYCNFLYSGCLFAPFIGILIGWVSCLFSRELKGNPFIIAALYPFMVSSLFWIRNSISSVYRATFWNLIVLIFLTYLFTLPKKRLGHK